MSEQKAFYIMTFTPLWETVADTLQNTHKIKPVLYAGLPLKNTSTSALAKAEFYHIDDARLANAPAHIKDYKPATLDPELAESFAEDQAVFYEMISRFSLGKKKGSFEQRRQYLWQLYRIWEGLFDSFKPDMVIGASMPHRVFDYLIYLICEKRNIPFVTIEATSLPHLSYICTSVHDQSKPFRTETDQQKPLSKETLDYFEYVKNPSSDYRPLYYSLTGISSQSAQKRQTSLKKILVDKLPQFLNIVLLTLKLAVVQKLSEKTATVFNFPAKESFSENSAFRTRKLDILLLTLRTYLRVGKAGKWYRRNLSKPDYTKPYIYFPSSFQPERGTVPDAGYFYDFPLILSMLEKAVPADWQIIYKEHPRIFRKPIGRDNPRDIDFYLRLREACPRIQFVDIGTESKVLIKNCKAIATAGGTAGWEGLTRGKPVFLFGQRWYGGCKGAYQIESLEDLKKAVAEILEAPEVPEEGVLDYLKNVEALSIDLSFYFKDNVEERAQINSGKDRQFTKEEEKQRHEFAEKMARYIAEHGIKSAKKVAA